MSDITREAAADAGRGEGDPQGSARDGLRAHAIEAAVGLVIAVLLLWTAIASSTDVPFVYQGL